MTLARAWGMTLAGYIRRGGFRVYAGWRDWRVERLRLAGDWQQEESGSVHTGLAATGRRGRM